MWVSVRITIVSCHVVRICPWKGQSDIMQGKTRAYVSRRVANANALTTLTTSPPSHCTLWVERKSWSSLPNLLVRNRRPGIIPSYEPLDKREGDARDDDPGEEDPNWLADWKDRCKSVSNHVSNAGKQGTENAPWLFVPNTIVLNALERL